ncbi:MAG: hypothetical protein ACKO1N_13140 [Erythrobacter sp.]
MKCITIMLAAASLCAPLAEAGAQDAMPEAAPRNSAPEPTFDASAHGARLDELGRKGDYSAISALLDAPRSQREASANLDWLGLQFRTGSSSFFSLHYSSYLAAFAERLPAAQAEQLRGTALAALVHAVMAAQSDAQQCADGTARGHLAARLLERLAGSGLTELHETMRKQAAFIALRVEEIGWDQRKRINDARYLCAGGLDAMIDGLSQGATREVETPKGQFGRTIAVTPPEGFEYPRLPDAEWWPRAESIRAKNSDTVMQLLDLDNLSFDPDQ